MNSQETDDNLQDLISIIDTVATDKLKRQGYQKYVDKIANVARRSLEVDATRLTIVIQYIKSYKEPCFQRDVLIDVLHRLVASHDLAKILIKPFPINKRTGWDVLATGITAIPDLIANCNCSDRYPDLRQETFYKLLSCLVYDAVEYQSRFPALQDEYKLFILKIVGRIAMSSHKQFIWEHLTLRAIREPRNQVKEYYFDLIRITLSSQSDHIPLGIFMEHLYSPIILNLRPSHGSGEIMRHILGKSVMTSEQLRYLICDKSLFKTNYNLAKERQAILLFNIAAYLSSLVTPSPHIDKDRCDNEATVIVNSSHAGDPSLLVTTLLEVVQNWMSSTKILIRTYQHSKYITYALVVLLRHAIQYDKKSLVDHAAEIQTLIARSIPTYLNRTSQELRDLATCMSGLVMPRLHDIAISSRGGQIAKDGEKKAKEEEELKLNFNVNLNDDLLYLQQLFQQDVEVLFQDMADTATTTNAITPQQPTDCTKPACPAAAHAAAATTDATTDLNNRMTNDAARRANDRQLRGRETKVESGDTTTTCRGVSKKIVVELDDQQQQQDCDSEAKVDNDDDDDHEEDDLKPYATIDDADDQQDNSDDDELALGEDAANVPIYLRDCINGLVENNSRLYVRLCLIKAGVLIDDLIEQDKQACDDLLKNHSKVSSFARSQPRQISYGAGGFDSTGRRDGNSTAGLGVSRVNDTIRDVGIELTRALLFLEDQFKTENFSALRMNCLISLCYAAPEVIGRYLIEEFNGQSRSIQQQLDILHILVASAHQLSTGSRIKHGSEPVLNKFKEAVCIRASSGSKIVNMFAPHAAMYFYGIVYRLKSDFADAGSLIISQPKSIMSAFRQQSEDQQTGAGSTAAGQADMIIKRAIAQEKGGWREAEKQRAPPKLAKSRLLDTNGEAADEEKFLETNCLSDDSFLLSRILISIANIISCSSQQVVTCKLSTDLLDILSAYRCHPDSGVQRAIVNCLRMIRDCTPSTYYKEYIEKRMMYLFGPWLSKNEANM